MDTISSLRRSYGLLVTATLLTVAAADFFFYGHMIGWTTAAFALILLIFLALRDSRFLQPAGGKIVLLSALGLLFALIEQPTWFNIAYIILCLGALGIINTFGWQRDFPEWARRWGHLLATGWMRLFSDNSVFIRCLARYGIPPSVARNIFAWTLYRARAKRWSASRYAAAPVARPTLSSSTTTVIHPAPLAGSRNISAALVVRCLILFNLVFLVENVLDVRFLGHKELLLPTGIEYKEYVRRGAYPLVAAALMAGAFVLVTFRSRSQTERSRWARRLVYLWIAQTIFLTATAAWRLMQYVELSELTRLRVASTIWFALVALGLVFIIWRIAATKTNRWLLNVNALTAVLVLYPCCFINFDGMIADFNINHCREGGGTGSALDIEYFRNLGTTSLAHFEEIRPKIGLEPGTAWRIDQARAVSIDLHDQLAREQSDWRAWTLRRARAVKAVEHQEELARAGTRQSPQLAQAESTLKQN